VTDLEVIDWVRERKGIVTVSLSDKGCFLRAGDEQHAITEEQADLIWEILPLIVEST